MNCCALQTPRDTMLDEVRAALDASSRIIGDATFTEFRLWQSRLHGALANNAPAMRDLRHSLNETEGSASSLRARVEQLHQENSKLFARLELAAKETSLLASEARDLTTKLELTSQGVAQRDTELAAPAKGSVYCPRHASNPIGSGARFTSQSRNRACGA
jgi:predicted nuclease with TOPRIM domain